VEGKMIRGLYTSGWSMKFNSKRMDVIANNLANVNTNGFKRDITVAESFPEMLTKRLNDSHSNSNPSGRIGTMELSSDVGEVYTYYNQGSLTVTDSKMDFSINDNGNSFFTIAIVDEDGNIAEAYTRDGAFMVNSDNLLVTKDGYPVMGQAGTITIYDKGFIVDEDGSIIQNGEITDRFLIRSFVDTTTLRKIGNNLIAATADSQVQPFNGVVKQGFLEQSNVNVIKEMVDMIAVMRAYESSQKMIQIQDETLGKAVNEVGRTG
jgi:flagellar basal-body rod protein FlgF